MKNALYSLPLTLFCFCVIATIIISSMQWFHNRKRDSDMFQCSFVNDLLLLPVLLFFSLFHIFLSCTYKMQRRYNIKFIYFPELVCVCLVWICQCLWNFVGRWWWKCVRMPFKQCLHYVEAKNWIIRTECDENWIF